MRESANSGVKQHFKIFEKLNACWIQSLKKIRKEIITIIGPRKKIWPIQVNKGSKGGIISGPIIGPKD